MSAAVAVLVILLLNMFGSPFVGSRTSGDIVLPGDSDEKIDVALTDEAPNLELLQSVTVGKDNIKKVVAALSRPDRYHISANSTIYYSTGQSTATAESYVDGERSHTIRYRGDTPQSHALISNGQVYLWEEGEPSYYKGNVGSFTEDDYVFIPTYERILSLPQSDILAADYSQYNEQYCIYVESRDSRSGYRVLYYISVDSGLLIGAQSFENDLLVYAMSCDLLDMPEDVSDLFTLPDGTQPE